MVALIRRLPLMPELLCDPSNVAIPQMICDRRCRDEIKFDIKINCKREKNPNKIF